MSIKFPIDYEPGKVQAFLISKETGQIIEATPVSEIVTPWPIDDNDCMEYDEKQNPLNFTIDFTIRKPMKSNQRRKLIRALSGKQKLPRKLKKALRHVERIEMPIQRIETENGFAFEKTIAFGPKDGYPLTKWVNRACLKLKAAAIQILTKSGYSTT